MRFQPDTWYEALLRPVAMGSPQANVYVEIMAPDFRFVFVVALLALWAALSLLGRRAPADAGTAGATAARPVFVLVAALALAFPVWLATTANGRYFLAGVLIAGPVCVGLTRLLPVTRALRLSLAVGMVALQAFAVQQSSPWQAWGLAAWKDAPYFHLEVPAQWRAQPATYVTMSAISYSLVGPLFHPQSRWLSLHNAPVPGSPNPDGRRVEAFLSGAQAGRLMLLVPALPGMSTPQRLPNAKMAEAIGEQLAPYRLAFAQPQSCQFLPSRGLADMGLGEKTQEQRSHAGFWLCQLARRDAGALPGARPGTRYDAVFKVLESQCPRFFPAGGDRDSVVLASGEVRSYLQAEMKAYVYDSGEVYYKYYRALAPVRVGTAADLLAGRARVDCGKIRGRAGLPWEREI